MFVAECVSYSIRYHRRVFTERAGYRVNRGFFFDAVGLMLEPM